MKNISVRFGMIASVIFIVWVSIEQLLGYNTTKMEIGQYTRLASAYVFWLFIIIALITKKKECGGEISFSVSLKAGILMVAVYSFITAVWLAIYQHFINPDFYSLIKQFTLEQLTATGKAQSEINDAMKEIDMMYNGSFLSYLLYFFFAMTAGSIIAFITSLIVRSRNKVVQ